MNERRPMPGAAAGSSKSSVLLGILFATFYLVLVMIGWDSTPGITLCGAVESNEERTRRNGYSITDCCGYL
jgi:hypothetical protein